MHGSVPGEVLYTKRCLVTLGHVSYEFTSLPAKIALSLSRHRENLLFPRLTELDAHAAAALGRYGGQHLDLRAIESLGVLRDPEGISPLVEALGKGEWWAPRRSMALRAASATALARIGTPEAFSALETAAAGSRRVRAVARPFLESRGRRGEGSL